MRTLKREDKATGNFAVSGTSLLSSSSSILEKKRPFTYLEYRTLNDFVEAVALHDKLLIIGPVASYDKSFLEFSRKLNSVFPGLVDIIETSDITPSVLSSSEFEESLRLTLQNTFTKISVSFVLEQVMGKPPLSRYSDDEKTSFLERSLNHLSGTSLISPDYQGLESFLADQLHHNRDSAIIKHACRAFVYAAFAHTYGGTALFTGSRKPIGALIRFKNPLMEIDTLPFLIYRHTNSLFQLAQQSAQSGLEPKLLHSLLLADILLRTSSRTEFLDKLVDLREAFKKYRERFYEKKRKLSDTSIESARKLRVLKANSMGYVDSCNKDLKKRGLLGSVISEYDDLFSDKIKLETQREVVPSEPDHAVGVKLTLAPMIVIQKTIAGVRKYYATRQIRSIAGHLIDDLLKFSKMPASEYDITHFANITNVSDPLTQLMERFEILEAKRFINHHSKAFTN